MKRLALATFLVTFTAACGSSHRSVPATATTASRSTTTTSTVARVKSDPAVWTVKSRDDISSRSTSFTAEVSRLGCNGGVTGTVLQPTVQADESRVVVTFTVARAEPGLHTCQSNRAVPFVVKLAEPIGKRQLVDGACRAGSEASTTAWCVVDGSVRWKA
jgi:hypothetical protein